jgi:aminomethyltransferase
MDETTTPYEAGLGWTVAMGVPQFIGQEVLRAQKENGLQRKFIGFTLEKGPVPRHGFPLFSGNQRVGEVTSGTFSPLLKQPLGMGYVAAAWANVGQALTMEVRNQRYPASVVKLPFWKAERLASAA